MSHRMMWGRRGDGSPLPQNYSGLKLWYDASDADTLFDAVSGGSPVVTNGSPVARWEDKSGNGLHLTQATSGQRPTLNVAAKNGLDALNFDGVNDSMTTGVQDIMRNVGSAYIFTVCQDTNPTGGDSNHFISILTSGGNSRWINYTRWNNNNVFRAATRRLPSDSLSSAAFSSDGNYNTHGTRLRFFGGGAAYSINQRIPVELFSPTTGNTSDIPGEFEIGGLGTTGSLPGNICELILLEDPASATDPDADVIFLNCIFSYLQNKWAITP